MMPLLFSFLMHEAIQWPGDTTPIESSVMSTDIHSELAEERWAVPLSRMLVCLIWWRKATPEDTERE